MKRTAARIGDPVLDNAGTRQPLSDPEKLFLKNLRRMVRRQEQFTYRRMADLCGWKSTQMAWQTERSLEAKGRLTIGKRLALVQCPVEVPLAA